MTQQTKKQKESAELAQKGKESHTVSNAVKLLKSFPARNFDQTVEVVMHLAIDPRHADQQLRGSVSMPKGVGRSARVICFCQTNQVDAAKAAGAVEAGGEDLVNALKVVGSILMSPFRLLT